MTRAGILPDLEVRVGRMASALARTLALFGGTILAAISVMVMASIIGRALDGWLFFSPITGDYELVEIGTAIAVFAFLPWCQLNRGHVSVDILTSRLPLRGQAITALIGDILLAIAAYIICWRLWLGFGEKFPYGSDGLRESFGMGYRPFFPETSYELEIPIWIAYGLSWLGSAAFLLVALYTVWRGVNEVLRGAKGEDPAI
ncbi:MAG: TRAP transporter small permease [Pseudomonadota bacterium]